MNEVKGTGEVYAYPKLIMASYGGRELFSQWITAAFGFTVFFYYEAVIGLDVKLAALAFIIYQVWNAINDPLTGYLMEHVYFPWEKKTGFRRAPFIIIGGILWLFSYLAIFLGPTGLDPVVHQWEIFAWYTISLCMYDLFATLFDVNVTSLFPEKFRGLNERRTVQAFGTILGIIGLVMAAIIPPMFITTGVAITYRNSAWATVVIGLILFLFMLPGTFESKQVRELYRRKDFYVLFVLTAVITIAAGMVHFFNDPQIVNYLKAICVLLISVSALIIAIVMAMGFFLLGYLFGLPNCPDERDDGADDRGSEGRADG